MRTVVLVTLWLAAFPLYATEFCQTLAEEARLAASLRDDGFTREDYIKQVAINISDDNLTADGYKLMASITQLVVGQVYQYPYNTPTQEANRMWKLCEEAQ